MVIYHYTTMQGFLGIARTKGFWATNIRYLNDASEFVHALDIGREVRDGIQSTLTRDESLLFDKLLRQDIPPDSLHEKLVTGLPYYVVSFSEDGDSLSQWRAYAGKSGYAIGIDPRALAGLAETRGLSLQACIYDRAEQHTRMRSLIERTADLYRKQPFPIDPAIRACA